MDAYVLSRSGYCRLAGRGTGRGTAKNRSSSEEPLPRLLPQQHVLPRELSISNFRKHAGKHWQRFRRGDGVILLLDRPSPLFLSYDDAVVFFLRCLLDDTHCRMTLCLRLCAEFALGQMQTGDRG